MQSRAEYVKSSDISSLCDSDNLESSKHRVGLIFMKVNDLARRRNKVFFRGNMQNKDRVAKNVTWCRVGYRKEERWGGIP